MSVRWGCFLREGLLFTDGSSSVDDVADSPHDNSCSTSIKACKHAKSKEIHHMSQLD